MFAFGRASVSLQAALQSFRSFFQQVGYTILMRNNLKERVNDTPTWVQRHAAKRRDASSSRKTRLCRRDELPVKKGIGNAF